MLAQTRGTRAHRCARVVELAELLVHERSASRIGRLDGVQEIALPVRPEIIGDLRAKRAHGAPRLRAIAAERASTRRGSSAVASAAKTQPAKRSRRRTRARRR